MTSPIPSKVPAALRARLIVIALSISAGGAVYVANQPATGQAAQDQYVQAVASDGTTSPAVKIAMVMGSYYESSGKHIGTPYVDKLGKGQPLTVCNGITGAGVVASRYYTPADCYMLDRSRYLSAERAARRLFRFWDSYDPFAQAVFIDFIHNKGAEALAGSTMLRKANAGDLAGACRENPRWTLGTVNGVKQVLGGLQIRGDSNGELCADWRLGEAS